MQNFILGDPLAVSGGEKIKVETVGTNWRRKVEAKARVPRERVLSRQFRAENIFYILAFVLFCPMGNTFHFRHCHVFLNGDYGVGHSGNIEVM